MNRVVIIGAGISGLTAAWWLHRAGVEVTVLEKESWAGGTIRTIEEAGWLVETGPNSALETTPLFGEMFDQLGISDELCYAKKASTKRYILRDEKLHALPMSVGAFLTSSLWSMGAKLRLLKEPFIGRADQEETIAEFVERRLGREFLDYAINPFVAGVYAGSPENLSVSAAFPKLYALEEKYGGLIRGMIGGARERKERAEKAKDRARMFSFRKGMQTFPAAIAKGLGDRLKLKCRVIGVDYSNNSAFKVVYESDVQRLSIEADVVVVAVPSQAASGLLPKKASLLKTKLESVYYPPVAEVFLGFRGEQVQMPLDGFGYLIPEKERRKILGTIWSSSLFEGRAPEGHVALTTFVGGSRQPELACYDEKDLVALVIKEIQSIMGVKGEPAYSRVFKWEKAIPQYNLGYHDVIEAINRFETENSGMFLCANYRGGIAVGDCVISAEKTASSVIELLNSKKKPVYDAIPITEQIK
jgi:oxygen-dependent protoporphyrinogen oxidase